MKQEKLSFYFVITLYWLISNMVGRGQAMEGQMTIFRRLFEGLSPSLDGNA